MTATQPSLSFEPAGVPRWRLSLVRESETPYDGADCRDLLTMPADVTRWLWRHVYHDEPREVVTVVYLDGKQRVVGYSVAYSGGLSRASVEPRGIIVPALLTNASGMILAHNHPSGDPSPSTEDLLFTRRLAEAGELVGVALVDHVIIGSETSWVSLRQRGAF